jgi:hypothetical protein
MSPISNDRQSLIDKIVKLLALADSTIHSEEADSARNMAATLMAKHNITIDTTVEEPFTVDKEDTPRAGSSCKYEDILINSISNLSGVATIRGAGYYKFVGKKTDIEAFQYTRSIIYSQRDASWQTYRKARWAKHPGASELNKWKLGFAYGVASKIAELLRMSDNKQQEWGLVPVQPHKQASDWYNEQHKTKSSHNRTSQFNSAGYSAGSQVSLNKGVEQQSGNRLQIA